MMIEPAIDQTCSCPNPVLCRELKQHINGRLWEIWNGWHIDPEMAEKYRVLWREQAAAGGAEKWSPAANANQAVDPQVDCEYLGEEVRTPAGEPVTRDCGGCGGGGKAQRLKVFQCTHPAREPDQVTGKDCQACDYRPRNLEGTRKLILLNKASPGDVLCMTAAIHSLHKAHPGKYATAVDTICDAIFEHNPDVIDRELAKRLEAEELMMHYPAINSCNQRGIHFMEGYCEFLEDALKVRIPLATNRPHVYLSKKERGWLNQVEEQTQRRTPFWLISAGRKSCYTAKFWGTENFQKVVDQLRGRVLFVQVGAAEHHHPPLKNVMNLTGKTDHRQLIRLAYHAMGGLGGVTFLQHLFAAWEKPYFCIMGGREPVQWNAYPRQQLFHTVGLLSCCKSGGCWKSRVIPLGDGDEKDKSLCEFPVIGDPETIPRCMALIRPEEVSEKILLTMS